MSVLSEDGRRALLAVYADIDAEGGDDPAEDVDFNRGFRVGLELALVKIDQMLNEGADPDEAWISEGLARLRSPIRASPAIGQPHRLEEPETRPDVEGLVKALTAAADEAQADHEDDVARIYEADGPIAGSVCQDDPVEVVISLSDARQAASALSAYEARVQELTLERDRLNERNVEVSVLAHNWMVAHDMRAAGKPYDYPSPADVPTCLAHAQATEARASAAEKERDGLQETLTDWHDRALAAEDRLTALEQKPEGEG